MGLTSYRTALTRDIFCGPGGIRTRDPRIKSALLYLLSYKTSYPALYRAENLLFYGFRFSHFGYKSRLFFTYLQDVQKIFHFFRPLFTEVCRNLPKYN